MQFGQLTRLGSFLSPQLTRRPLDETLPHWGVLLLESHHDVGFSMQPRTHAFLKILYVLQGAGMVTYPHRQESFGVGDCLIVPPGTANSIEDQPSAAASLYICCVSSSLLAFDPTLLDRFPAGKLKADSHVANRVASHLRRLAYAQQQESEKRPLTMVTETMRLLQVICDQLGWQRVKPTAKRPAVARRRAAPAEPAPTAALSPSQASLIERYTRRLEERFFEATTIDEAAASVGLSRRTFTRAFSEHTGETWLHYVRRLAIDHATKLLQATERPIAAIAFECGFNDLSTFYRQFKSRMGVSPADYRRQFRSEP